MASWFPWEALPFSEEKRRWRRRSECGKEDGEEGLGGEEGEKTQLGYKKKNPKT